MKSILIVNPKGGAGKTTLATNLAGGLAGLGDQEVRLWDLDRQHSAMQWLSLRPADRPVISPLVGRPHESGRTRDGAGWLILDAPGFIVAGFIWIAVHIAILLTEEHIMVA